jgi:hypothetical protein
MPIIQDNKYWSEYYHKNIDRYKEYYFENKEHYKEYHKKYQKENREVVNQYSRNFYQKRKESNPNYNNARILAYYHKTKNYKKECKRLRMILLN